MINEIIFTTREETMSIIFHWVGKNYIADMNSFGKDCQLNQDNELMNDLTKGDHIWAFTRRLDKTYVLALDLVVEQARINSPSDPGYKYGEYNVLGNKDSRYFDIAKGVDVETLIRSLSVTVNAKILGHSFQGKTGIKQITDNDEQKLIAFAGKLP
jgi:hypothetical protein